ncbi:MAG: glycosyltransferase family 39 protein [Planctomycetota bacterium]
MTSGNARTAVRVLCVRPRLTILTLLGILYLPWIGALPLDGTLEGNRLEAAREMLASGDWLVPRLGGAPYLAKPPFHPWSLALCGLPAGDLSLWIGRGLSAACTLFLCLCVHRWARRELGRRAALFAAVALGTSVLVLEKGVRAELESELALWTALALLLFFESGRCAERREAVWRLLAAGLALGAAILTKGPPPLIVFACAALTLALAAERRRFWLAAGAAVAGLALLCFLAWVLPAGAELGFAELLRSFRTQFTERLTQAGRTNAEPFWFYAPALVVALAPAVLCAPVLALVLPARVQDLRARERALFLWGWALGPCLLFSLSSGKETRYLLPVLPAWALLLAWGWRRARSAERLGAWRRVLVTGLARASWIAPALWLVAGGIFFPEARGAVLASAAAGFLAWAVLGRSLARGHARAAFLALAGLLATGKYAWAETVLARQRRALPIAEVAATVRANLAPDEAWVLLGPYRSWWHFSVARPCLAVADWSALSALEPAPARLVLAPEAALPLADTELRTLGRWSIDGDPYRLIELAR